MPHIEAAQLQAYLGGETDLADTEQIAAHLSQCPQCSAQLAELAADDTWLTRALALDAEERAWIESMDLVAPVRRRLPGYGQPQTVLVAALLLLAGGWLVDGLAHLLGRLITWQGPIGLAVEVTSALAALAWHLVLYLAKGGLLADLWPVLATGAAVWLVYRRYKEANRYA